MSNEEHNELKQEPEDKTSYRQDLYSWLQATVMALVIFILTFTLVGRCIIVSGPSMMSTLHDRDVMLLQSIAYRPKAGDVVVLRKDSFMASPIVKRVIATGGQHVQVDMANNAVYVDGVQLDEPYINEPMEEMSYYDEAVVDVVIPEGSIYVMGDNRNHSSDSRDPRLGVVDERYVMGRSLMILFPFRDFGMIR